MIRQESQILSLTDPMALGDDGEDKKEDAEDVSNVRVVQGGDTLLEESEEEDVEAPPSTSDDASPDQDSDLHGAVPPQSAVPPKTQRFTKWYQNRKLSFLVLLFVVLCLNLIVFAASRRSKIGSGATTPLSTDSSTVDNSTLSPGVALSPSPAPTGSNFQWKQVWQLQGSEAGEKLGVSVAMSHDGQRMVVGGEGTCRIYETSSSEKFSVSMDLSTQLTNTVQVALSGPDGRHLVVADVYHSTAQHKNAGSVLVFEHYEAVNKWNAVGDTLVGRDDYDAFGFTLALSGDGRLLAVGTDGRYVKVFLRRDDASPVWRSTNMDLEIPGWNFGRSVSMDQDANVLAVGASFYQNRKGGVPLYKLPPVTADTTHEDFVLSLIVPVDFLEGDNEGDMFGAVVAMSGDGSRLAVGSSGVDTVKIFEENNQAQAETATETTPLYTELNTLTGSTKSRFGYDISFSKNGHRLVVGAPFYKVDNDKVYGKTFVYDVPLSVPPTGKTSKNIREVSTIVGERPSDFNGWSVSVSGNGKKFATGAKNNDGESADLPDSGHVRIYAWRPTE